MYKKLAQGFFQIAFILTITLFSITAFSFAPQPECVVIADNPPPEKFLTSNSLAVFKEPPPTCENVIPRVECVLQKADSFIIYFGYQSENATKVQIEFSARNLFKADGAEVVDPINELSPRLVLGNLLQIFQPGDNPYVFGLELPSSLLSFEWDLNAKTPKIALVNLTDPSVIQSSCCGNGEREEEEFCDDGYNPTPTPTPTPEPKLALTASGFSIEQPTRPSNSDAPNAFCRRDCTLSRCGDGIVDDNPQGREKEECDDKGESETCTADCKLKAIPLPTPTPTSTPTNPLGDDLQGSGTVVGGCALQQDARGKSLEAIAWGIGILALIALSLLRRSSYQR